MARKWGKIWNIIGIAGTGVLVGLTGYVVVESAKNPLATPPGVMELAIVIEIFQVSYVIITAMILGKYNRSLKTRI